MPIKILPESTIDKIAAGEVIERPANALKELVENSLDAQSTSIEIELKGAGRKLIRVRDNGLGIPNNELKLAVTRHATSKISSFDDLEKLHSMGFRGEALPSIAAVSNLLIQSRPLSAVSGWEINLSGGKLKHEGVWAGAEGTNIEVSNLFFNIPAREKFLKSETTERSRAIKITEELALARHDVAFKVISEGKTVLETPASDNPLERIMDVLGNDFSSKLMRVEVAHPFLKINAFITGRENSLPSKNYQYLFVNKRPVNLSRSIAHSLYEAYRENLPAGRHPGAVIFLEIDPAEMDVNIHPTKREVRFSREQQIHHLIYTSIKNALAGQPALGIPVNSGFDNNGDGQKQSGITAHDYGTKTRALPGNLSEPSAGYSYSRMVSESGIFSRSVHPKIAQPEFERENGNELSKKVIGQLFNLYIIVQDGEGLLIIDQHAAAERIRYEKYLAQWGKKNIALQPLLFPENIELTPSLFSVASASMELLKDSGWDTGEFGSNTIRVSSIPAVLGNNASTSNMLKEILEALSEEKNIPNAEKIEKLIRAACRASIKAGDTLSNLEAAKLVEELFKCRAPNTCPHGRPTMLKIPKHELEKHFSRK